MRKFIDYEIVFTGTDADVQEALDGLWALRLEYAEAETNGVAGYPKAPPKVADGECGFWFWTEKWALADEFVDAAAAMRDVGVRLYAWTDDGELLAWASEAVDGEWRLLGEWEADVCGEGQQALILAAEGDPSAAALLCERIGFVLECVGLDDAEAVAARGIVYARALAGMEGADGLLAEVSGKLLDGLNGCGADTGPLLEILALSESKAISESTGMATKAKRQALVL